MTKILLIGASGFVGTEVSKYLTSHGYILSSPSSNDLDITKVNSIKKYSKENDVVINLAAYTDVRNATLDKNGSAWKLNVNGVRNVANVCKQTNKFLIQISTDAVFPFDKHGPHSELEKITNYPKFYNAYGYTKLQGEIEIKKSEARAAIVRISYPFGNPKFPQKDYIMKIIRLMKLGHPLFADQQLTPTYLKNLSEMIEKLIELQIPGIFHCVCKKTTTPYKIGSLINKKLKLKAKIKKGYLYKNEKSNEHFYPKFGGLKTENTEKQINIKMPILEKCLEDYIPVLKSHL